MLKRGPQPEIVVKDSKKSNELMDVALDMMKEEISNYFQMLVDDSKLVDPKFPVGEVRHFMIF